MAWINGVRRSAAGGLAAVAGVWAGLLPNLDARAAHNPALRIQVSDSKHVPVFVTAVDGGPIPVSRAPGRAAIAPLDFLVEHAAVFGIDDPARQLVHVGAHPDALGFTHSTFEQVHLGVRVFTGELKVHQDSLNQVRSVNGSFHAISPKLSTTPAIDSQMAEDIAAAALGLEAPSVAGSELVIVDPGWYGDAPLGARLAHYLILDGPVVAGPTAVFVDAHSGELLDRWSMRYSVIDRSIHNGGGLSALPGPLARSEGDVASANGDVNAAYDYAGDTYDYFWRGFGRDGMDGQGGVIVATVNSAATGCPNAAYSFNLFQSVFCTGVVSDDILAHELTHALTQFTANLIYQNQSGQLNESFSDVFGELVDLFNGDAAFAGTNGVAPLWPTHATGPGQDTPNDARIACSPGPSHTNGVRWLVGEDANAFTDALRDMWSPTCYDDPDSAYSPLQTCSLIDNGGVHTGSGIPNHAFAILTDGKSFNGYSVNGIGPIKAGAVWYRALSAYLTVASDFEDAYYALNQAAADLVGSTPNDPRTGLPSSSMFTASDALEVDKALLAVQMNTPGRCGMSIPVLDSTPPFQCSAPDVIFADDFESGAAGWSVSNTSPPTPYNWVLTSAPLPFGRPGAAWVAEDRNIGGCGNNDPGESGVHHLDSPLIALPADLQLPVLSFAHFVELEPRWDGGEVRLSVNGGPWQVVPRAAFHQNPYNFTLFTTTQFNTNPYAGRVAFTSVGGDWGTSLIDLAPFVAPGDTLQVRFDFSKDHCYGLTGWFVDDFAVYHCPASGDCDANGIPDDVDVSQGPYRPRFLNQSPNRSSGNPSDIDGGGITTHAFADNFTLLRPRTIGAIKLWGGYFPDNIAAPDNFMVQIRVPSGSVPGAVLHTRGGVASTRAVTGAGFLPQWIYEYLYELTLDPPISLDPGTYFIEILNDTTGHPSTFIWERATVGDIPGAAGSAQAPGVTWGYDPLINMSFELYGPIIGSDCEEGGVPDGIPDECQPFADCNANLLRDTCDVCGDHDGDGDGDLADYAVMAGCLGGPGFLGGPACTCLLDADADADLDLVDYASFQACIGPS